MGSNVSTCQMLGLPTYEEGPLNLERLTEFVMNAPSMTIPKSAARNTMSFQVAGLFDPYSFYNQ